MADKLTRIGGFAISDSDFESAAETIWSHVRNRSRSAVFFANTHFVVTCQPLRKRLAQMASMTILNDGSGLAIARWLLGKGRFAENLNGTDFIPRLLRESPVPLRLYLLGAEKASVEGAAAAFGAMEQVEVAGLCNGYALWEREDEVIKEINDAKPDILLVALGCPLQESWIIDNFHRFDVPVAFGVGALFDFVSGRQARAPRFMRKYGFEWLFRLWCEPRRLAYRYTFEVLAFLRIIFSNAFHQMQIEPPKLDGHVH